MECNHNQGKTKVLNLKVILCHVYYIIIKSNGNEIHKIAIFIKNRFQIEIELGVLNIIPIVRYSTCYIRIYNHALKLKTQRRQNHFRTKEATKMHCAKMQKCICKASANSGKCENHDK